ncbi:SDR family oxidoreductase [Pseudomaricurvus alkylphenolicus]|uniref:SDR family NAD(P)-dependent oxidoreductase n=1 Tax=Pseudomaricurvus alkylphenolicus TaxID=1306991 RepID=UPI0014203BFC|nr:SDR family oxidoreductase [Pseudomaricurvus alkylphenolicus]NIB44117.1 SDR family oxidoreductase [Pseudomaricurvus alkylphenolicus]
MNSGKLAGRVAVITGAAGGLGAEAARVLASHGASIVVVDLNQNAAQQVAVELRDKGADAIAVETDVSDEDSVKAMVQIAVGEFGRIDILHNNAAILSEEQRSGDLDVVNMDVDAWDRAMAVNLRGAMLCSKHCIPEMIKLQRGSVINATSGLGTMGDLTLSAYAASKAALIMLAKSIAAQYGKQGVRANALLIGLAPAENAHATMPEKLLDIIRDNHLTPKLGTPRQIADAVAFLASDEASFVTGSVLSVDGGFCSHTPSLAGTRELFAELGSNKM